MEGKEELQLDSSAATLADEKRDTSTVPSLRKTSLDNAPSLADKDERGSTEDTSAGEEDEGEYPNGIKMVFIVVALALSIFLVWI